MGRFKIQSDRHRNESLSNQARKKHAYCVCGCRRCYSLVVIVVVVFVVGEVLSLESRS